jgi:hypothetical protein
MSVLGLVAFGIVIFAQGAASARKEAKMSASASVQFSTPVGTFGGGYSPTPYAIDMEIERTTEVTRDSYKTTERLKVTATGDSNLFEATGAVSAIAAAVRENVGVPLMIEPPNLYQLGR